MRVIRLDGRARAGSTSDMTLRNAIAISERPVDSRTVLTLRLARGGGQAIRIRPASGAQ